MDFEAVEPARAGLATLGQLPEDLVRLDPQVVADLDRGRVNEGDACARSETRVQESGQRPEGLALQLDEPLVADQVWEFFPQKSADVLPVVGLQVAEAGGLKKDNNRHDFAQAQGRYPMAMALSIIEAMSAQRRLKKRGRTRRSQRTIVECPW